MMFAGMYYKRGVETGSNGYLHPTSTTEQLMLKGKKNISDLNIQLKIMTKGKKHKPLQVSAPPGVHDCCGTGSHTE